MRHIFEVTTNNNYQIDKFLNYLIEFEENKRYKIEGL